MVTESKGGKAYLQAGQCRCREYRAGACTNQAQNEMKNPHQEKKNTRPYLLTGLRTGIERAFLLIGLMAGAFQRTETPIFGKFVRRLRN